MKKEINPEILEISLRMIGLRIDMKTVSKIIDIVEVIEQKGDEMSLKDIAKLEAEWSK